MPNRCGDGLGCGKAGRSRPRQGVDRADQWQYGDRARVRGCRAWVPPDLDHAGNDEPRATEAARRVRRQVGAHARSEGHERGRREGRRNRGLQPGTLRALAAIQEPGQPCDSREHDGPRNLGRHGRQGRYLRIGRRHGGYHHGRQSLLQEDAQPAAFVGRG